MNDVLNISLVPDLIEASGFNDVKIIGKYRQHSTLFSVKSLDLQILDSPDRVLQAVNSVHGAVHPDGKFQFTLNGVPVEILKAAKNDPTDDPWARFRLRFR